MVFERSKQNVSHLLNGRPGRRFQSLYRRRREQIQEHPVRGRILIAVGCVLVVTGMLLSIPPGMPGFIVTFAGLGMIVARSAIAARVLDSAEILLWKCWRKVRSLKEGSRK